MASVNKEPNTCSFKGLSSFPLEKERDSGNVVNVISTEFFYTMILNALCLAFERGSTLCSKHMKTVHRKLFDITVVYSYLKDCGFFVAPILPDLSLEKSQMLLYGAMVTPSGQLG